VPFIRRAVAQGLAASTRSSTTVPVRLVLFTYELRHGSKAENVLLREVNIADEDILWKELLIFS